MLKYIPMLKTLSRYWKMAQDPRTPPIVRYLIYAGLAYTLSPIDLLPDAIPFLGLMDDAAVLPTLITLAMTMIPKEVKRSHEAHETKELNRIKGEGHVKAEQAEVEAALKLKPYQKREQNVS